MKAEVLSHYTDLYPFPWFVRNLHYVINKALLLPKTQILQCSRKKHWSGKSVGWIFLHRDVEKITSLRSFVLQTWYIQQDFVNKGICLVHRDSINYIVCIITPLSYSSGSLRCISRQICCIFLNNGCYDLRSIYFNVYYNVYFRIRDIFFLSVEILSSL